MGLTKNFSCEGFSFTFQNFALEPRQKLEFKLRHPRTNSMISFLGDVIWQQQKDIKYSAGVKVCDLNNKNKKIMLKAISDSCNISVNSLLDSNDTVKLLRDELISRKPDRFRSKFRWLYITALILATTATVLFIPAVIANFKDGSSKPITKFIKSMAINNTNKIKDVSQIKNGQISNIDIQTVNNSVQLQADEISNLMEVLEENIPSAIKKKEPDIKLPVTTKDVKEENKFYIQVTAIKDSDDAHGFLSELKQDYPAAYIYAQNDFYKVRIPDIRTSVQGYDLIKDIEMKFDMKPILVKRVQ